MEKRKNWKAQRLLHIRRCWKAFVESSKEDSNNAKFTVYTVVAGDTLAKICSEHGLDYNTNIRIIIELNGIENVNLIYVGQKILLPLYWMK